MRAAHAVIKTLVVTDVVDKTDGFLLLFDQPIDACRIVLAYHWNLAELSRELGLELCARAGIHLGEVFLRQN